jgi:hypothetical protein
MSLPNKYINPIPHTTELPHVHEYIYIYKFSVNLVLIAVIIINKAAE